MAPVVHGTHTHTHTYTYPPEPPPPEASRLGAGTPSATAGLHKRHRLMCRGLHGGRWVPAATHSQSLLPGIRGPTPHLGLISTQSWHPAVA